MRFAARPAGPVIECAGPWGHAVGSIGAVNTNRAQEQVRPAGRLGQATALESHRAAADQAEVQPQPVPQSGRQWSIRVHWGIVFAVVASLILWLLIKTVVALVF